MSALENFTRDFAATQASHAYSNTTFALRYGGMFAMLNQIVQHLLSEHVAHGLRACFATKGDWAYAPDPAFERAHGCERQPWGKPRGASTSSGSSIVR